MTQAANLATVGSNANSGGTLITSGTAQASTSGTSIDFTGIPAWVKRITVMLNGVSTNGSSNLQLQLGAGSVVTTGYGSSASLQGSSNTTAGANSTTGLLLTGQNAATCIYYGSAFLTLVGSNIWVCSSSLGRSDSVFANNSGGGITLGGTLDRVRVTTVNGTDTFDAGSINILWE